MENNNSENFYPQIHIDLIKNPNRLWAFPILGGLIKYIILIPVGIELLGVGIAALFLLIANSFVVLFTGKYLKSAYNLFLGFIVLGLKCNFFFSGLTNQYPGFSLSNTNEIALNMPYPLKPNRLWAFPIFSGLIRIIMLIPYLIFITVITYGAGMGQFIGSFKVLFLGIYPESIYEISRDQARVYIASYLYLAGISDKYPSFRISMHHKVIKIILIIFAAFTLLANSLPKQTTAPKSINNYNYPNYQQPVK